MGKGARTKRIERIAAALPIVGELTNCTSEADSNWMTRRWDYRADGPVWLTTPFSINARGDSPLAESNYRVIAADLEKVAAYGTDYRVDLWPGGSIHTLQVRADDALALSAVQRWVSALADYPVADDDDLSALESETIYESFGQWAGSDIYRGLPEWAEELWDSFDYQAVEDEFWIAVYEYAGSDVVAYIDGDTVAWDFDAAEQIMIGVLRRMRRRELGREAA